MTLAGLEVQLHILRQNAVEQRSHELLADTAAGNLEAQRVDALVQHVERLGVGSLGVLSVNVLTHEPQVVVFLVATHERELARQRVHCLQVFQVFATIERLHVEAFIGSPDESFLEVGPFQVHLNLVQPLLGGWRLKLAEEFFFVV